MDLTALRNFEKCLIALQSGIFSIPLRDKRANL